MDSYHQHKKLPLNFDLVVPFLKFEKELLKELLLLNVEIYHQNKYYFLVAQLTNRPIWAQEWLPNIQKIDFKSKSESVQILKSQKNLGAYLASPFHHKMAESLSKEIRLLPLKRIRFEVPSRFNFNYFVWTLFEDQSLLICTKPHSQFPLGWHEFDEDKMTPPNRAYLKLWEALSLNYITLKPHQTAVELGSSPGGWSWVLSQQLKQVYSVDKAPLSSEIQKIKNIMPISADAFQVKTSEFKNADWLFSDIICTPQRLLELVTKWQNETSIENYFCTIKFKGECNFDILNEFLKFECSRIIHLYQNKNEVTWIKQGIS